MPTDAKSDILVLSGVKVIIYGYEKRKIVSFWCIGHCLCFDIPPSVYAEC